MTSSRFPGTRRRRSGHRARRCSRDHADEPTASIATDGGRPTAAASRHFWTCHGLRDTRPAQVRNGATARPGAADTEPGPAFMSRRASRCPALRTRLARRLLHKPRPGDASLHRHRANDPRNRRSRQGAQVGGADYRGVSEAGAAQAADGTFQHGDLVLSRRLGSADGRTDRRLPFFW